MLGRFVIYGALFGFVLSRAGATDYDAIHGMFMLTDPHLMGVIGLAVAVGAAGFAWLRRREGGEIPVKPMTPHLYVGSLVFGVGWAIAGTCPGTALAQIGEGRWAGLATFAGMLLGTLAYARLAPFADAAAPLKSPES